MFQASGSAGSQGEYMPGVRFAGVMKAKGVSYEGVGKVVTFMIEKVGLLKASYRGSSKTYRMASGRFQWTRLRSD